MTSEMGGGSYGFTFDRLTLGEELLANTENMTLESFLQVFKARPILVYPGKPTGRTIMQMTAEIPKDGNPVLYLTPDLPNIYKHVQFAF